MNRRRKALHLGLLGSALFLCSGVTTFALVQVIRPDRDASVRKRLPAPDLLPTLPPATSGKELPKGRAAEPSSPPEGEAGRDRPTFEKAIGGSAKEDTEAARPDATDPLQARFNYPRGITVDSSGAVYIADSNGNRVVKVTPQGKLAPVTGSGKWWFSGDGDYAVRAEVASPEDVAVDSRGNVYIADRGNSRIRKIDRGGIITTVAGSGRPGELAFSGDGGPASEARLSVLGLAVDRSDNLYFADMANHRIRKVDRKGVVTTVAGSGPSAPEEGGYAGDGGPATKARLYQPNDVAFDGDGNMYIADSGNGLIRKVDTDGIITTVAGGHFSLPIREDATPAMKTGLSQPFGLAVDSKGNLYISDTYLNCIRKVTPDGKIETVAGNPDPGPGSEGYTGDNGPAKKALIHTPHRIALDAKDNLYIMDAYNNRVRKVSAATGEITTFAGSGPTCDPEDGKDKPEGGGQ